MLGAVAKTRIGAASGQCDCNILASSAKPTRKAGEQLEYHSPVRVMETNIDRNRGRVSLSLATRLPERSRVAVAVRVDPRAEGSATACTRA